MIKKRSASVSILYLLAIVGFVGGFVTNNNANDLGIHFAFAVQSSWMPFAAGAILSRVDRWLEMKR